MKRRAYLTLGVTIALLASVASNWWPISLAAATAQEAVVQLPSYPLAFGAFIARFDPGGTFSLQGKGWPSMNGNWKSQGAEIELSMSGGPGGCDGPANITSGSRVSASVSLSSPTTAGFGR